MNAERPEIAYATLRFLSDELDPRIVTDAVGHEPTLSYRKGEIYRQGRRQREIVGRTGVWLLSTKALVSSCRLDDHIDMLTSVLSAQAERPDRVLAMVRNHGYEADASCFWAGSSNTRKPIVPQAFRELIAQIGGDLEIAFHPDDEATDRVAAE